jgi:NAD(P)-dependent dehydrogenase (short-subunit alcohol dehydrogenase family)/peroxiredoxin
MSNSTMLLSYQERLEELQENLAKMLPEEVLNTFSQDALALAKTHQRVLKLNAGDKAPDFTLNNAKGEPVTLSKLLDHGKVILVFYRGSWCPYCNLQLKQYQEALPEITSLGAQLVAISAQTPDESLSLKEKNELQFEVLSDNGNMVARKFTTVFKNAQAPLEAMAQLGIDFDSHYADDSKEIPVPAVFIIGKNQNVLFAQSEGGDYRNRVEVAELLNALNQYKMEKRIWLITGISSGLGKALSQSVMDSGDFVIGTFRSTEQVEAFNVKYAQQGFAVKLDLRDEKGINETLESLIEKFGRIDVLVNNAGVGFVGAIEESSLAEVRSVFEANFFGTLKLSQAVLPHMRKRKKGRIVQISSHGGIKAFAGFGIYNASKFALEGFSEALAQEVGPLGIKVSLVEPGPFRTNFAGDKLGVAALNLADYTETAATFKAKLKGVHGKQEGDPMKAALAIITLVNAENPPLRLPLGKVALKTIEAKLESVKADLEANRALASNAVYL